MDLEQFRLDRGLSYRQLAALLGQTHASKTRGWALGAARLEADELECIIRVTGGAVTLEAMHRRRLHWLKERGRASIPDNAHARAPAEAS